jgi:predicted  nucleic acid-binding Zn-ribbon protein
VQALSDRVKVLETQVTDLLEIVKRLTGSLEEARKALAAKESELRAKEEQIQSLLQGAPKTPKKPK